MKPMAVHFFSVLAFMVVSFAAQGMSHFVIFKDHFSAISFMRPEPVIALGLMVMVIQGALMSGALRVWKGKDTRLADGFCVALAFGAFLVSYIAVVEPSKYAVPAIGGWFGVEAAVGLVQFTVFGVVLGWIHRRF